MTGFEASLAAIAAAFCVFMALGQWKARIYQHPVIWFALIANTAFIVTAGYASYFLAWPSEKFFQSQTALLQMSSIWLCYALLKDSE